MIFNMVGGGGTAAGLNFKVVGGTSVPSNPTANTIWVNTGASITSWHFGAKEPNVWEASIIDASDLCGLRVNRTLSDGDILNITIPATVDVSWISAIRISDISGNLYYVRNSDGTAISSWAAGNKVGLRISNTKYPINGWGDNGGSAIVVASNGYYHDAGTVWIATGSASNAEFNALKKNDIMVYPLSAKQYVNGAWVDKEAKSYQNGSWVDWWNGELYDTGNEYEAFTGGWTATTINSSTTVTKDATSMTIKTDYGDDALHCSNKMDLTDFSKLVVTGKSFRNNSSAERREGNTKICVWSAIGSSVSNNQVAYANYPAADYDGKFELDVSGLTGEYYVGVFAGRYYSVTVRKVKLS